MAKTVKDAAQARLMNAKGEGLYESTNSARTQSERSIDPEKLPLAQLDAKIVKLSEFIMD